MISIYLIPLVFAIFLAINMGASGTSPSFSAVYGADLIGKDLIPGLFGFFVFLGVIVAGKKVVLTIGSGIIPSELMALSLTTIIVLSISLSLLFANLLGVPQSTSQSTIFALIGAAIYLCELKTDKLFFEIIPTWFITPVLAFLIALIVGKVIYNPLKEKYKSKIEWLSSSTVLKYFVIGAACYVAFSIGSNNVANAAGPILAMATNELNISINDPNIVLVIIIISFMIAPFFGIGSSMMGHRVLKTTGKEIVSFGPLGASLISVITATLLLLASTTRGIPTSLVQMNTGAIIGLGISKLGWQTIKKDTPFRKILVVWIIAPLIAMAISLSLTIAADYLGVIR